MHLLFFSFLFGTLFYLAQGRGPQFTQTPLDVYVNTPDSHYAWVEMNNTFHGPGYKGYILNMTSQMWLTYNDTNQAIWWHYLAVVIPDDLEFTDKGVMYITGGSNHDSPPTGDGEDELLCIAIALTDRVVCTVLFQIPNEPISFVAEQPPRSRTEDAIIAYTWNHFFNDPSDPTWLLRLPMTKAAVRCMDTTTAYIQQKTGHIVNQFIVAGASKRGWTTWTTAAVDSRVIAFVPMVMDLLNMSVNLHHQWRNLGGWTFAFNDYYDFNFTAKIDEPQLQMMANIIDPYVYRDRYVGLPKLVVDAGGDEFFQPDDNWYWWNALDDGELHLLMVQNAEHSLATGIPEVVEGVSAFIFGVLKGQPRPRMSWTFGENYNGGNITINLSQAPRKIVVRWADTLDDVRRDWRLITGANPCPSGIVVSGDCFHPVIWKEQEPFQVGDLSWTVVFDNPLNAWRAFFFEVTFDSAGDIPYVFTSQVNIIPDTYPFPPCVGSGCRGTLV